MSDRFDIHKGAEDLEHAAKVGDGLSALQILEEASVCKIQALVKETNHLARDDQFRLSIYASQNGIWTQFTLYKVGDNSSNSVAPQRDNRVVPLATITGRPEHCEK